MVTTINVVFTLCIALIILFVLTSLIQKWCRRSSAIHYHEGIKTLIVSKDGECKSAIKELLSYSPSIVGFDLEWKSKKVKHETESKVCLMQIAFDKKLIILIRLHLLPNIPSPLISFLCDITILKCGVGIYGDAKKLKNDYNIEMCGCVELNHIYLSIDNKHNIFYGLEKFSNYLLKKEMKYKHDINHIKWESIQLTKQQIDYAANDALIGYQIFMHIFDKKPDKNNDILQFCFGKIDTNLLSKKSFSKINHRKSHKHKNNKNKFEQNGPKAVECICNNKMLLVLVKHCVKNNKNRVQNKSKYIVCNKCLQEQKDGNAEIYECKEQKSIFCERGYFLCIACSMKPKEENYEFKILDINGELLHCCSLRMFTLFRASKDWVKRCDRYTIQMNVEVDIINPAHPNNEAYFRHISWITPKKCYVCDSDQKKIFVFKIIPKWFMNNILGYRVPLCSQCRSKYHKQRSLFCHELCVKYLMKTDRKYELIYDTKNIKQYIDCLQYDNQRKLLNVDTQNKYIADIVQFYYSNYVLEGDEPEMDVCDLRIKDCEFNAEIGIDWWRNKGDYKTIFIRNIIYKICAQFCRKRHDDYMKKILNEYFKETPLQFAELIRRLFMEDMKPINYNKKYPAFEVMYIREDNLVFDPNDDTWQQKSSFVELNDDK